jgi:hypothetical protein
MCAAVISGYLLAGPGVSSEEKNKSHIDMLCLLLRLLAKARYEQASFCCKHTQDSPRYLLSQFVLSGSYFTKDKISSSHAMKRSNTDPSNKLIGQKRKDPPISLSGQTPTLMSDSAAKDQVKTFHVSLFVSLKVSAGY